MVSLSKVRYLPSQHKSQRVLRRLKTRLAALRCLPSVVLILSGKHSVKGVVGVEELGGCTQNGQYQIILIARNGIGASRRIF